MKIEIALFLFLTVAFVACLPASETYQEDDVVIDDGYQEDKRSNNHGFGPCHNKWTRYEGFYYHVSSVVGTWRQAQDFCGRCKGNLVKITSAEENDFVLYLFNKFAKQKVMWIGLTYWGSDKKFHWTDGSLATQYNHWAPGEPNGNAAEPCGTMYTNLKATASNGLAGSWNDLKCDPKPNAWKPRGFVCERIG